MKLAADANVLVRALMDDDVKQNVIARSQLEQAELVFVSTPTLCELAWVSSSSYRFRSAQIAQAIRRVIEVENFSADWERKRAVQPPPARAISSARRPGASAMAS